jgi:HD domain
MGDNPALPRMPAKPTLADFFHHRFGSITFRHLLQSATLAQKAGQDEKIIIACLLHDIANGCLVRCDHGYWGAQMIAPYVSEEIAWAVKYHQPLRYVPDPSVGYDYPEAYLRFFGPDFVTPDYVLRDAAEAKKHKWYMSARAVTLYDAYAFDDSVTISLDPFMELIGRHFRQPEEGLGFDGSPAAHMWRTMIWPNNFL